MSNAGEINWLDLYFEMEEFIEKEQKCMFKRLYEVMDSEYVGDSYIEYLRGQAAMATKLYDYIVNRRSLAEATAGLESEYAAKEMNSAVDEINKARERKVRGWVPPHLNSKEASDTESE